ncbi:MAG: 4Fe-4S binding protein [Clostridia bacterium]|nr:4Fe-4S binding protein [Clostridia bacterium]
MATKKKLVLNTAWCKGCGVCAAFCPKNVLALKGDKIAVQNEEACIRCGLCELRCPDYAIWLEEVEA